MKLPQQTRKRPRLWQTRAIKKERVRYTFTFKRIDAATRDTDKLNFDICDVLELLKRKIVPLDEIGTELSLSRPYLVTYSKP